MKMDPKEAITNAIAANLNALTQRLIQAAELAQQAAEAMDNGEQNQAIGTIIGFEQTLPEIQALYTAAMIMHRNSR